MIDFNRTFKTDAENGDTDERDFDFVEEGGNVNPLNKNFWR